MDLQKFNEDITNALELVTEHAKTQADSYWSMFILSNRDKKNHELGHYGPRVRVRPGGSVNIIWELWLDRKDKSLKIAQQVAPLKNGYTKKCFPKVKDWEWELIEECEAVFSRYRKYLQLLRKLQTTINKDLKKTQIPTDSINGEYHG